MRAAGKGPEKREARVHSCLLDDAEHEQEKHQARQHEVASAVKGWCVCVCARVNACVRAREGVSWNRKKELRFPKPVQSKEYEDVQRNQEYRSAKERGVTHSRSIKICKQERSTGVEKRGV